MMRLKQSDKVHENKVFITKNWVEQTQKGYKITKAYKSNSTSKWSKKKA